MIKCRKIKDLRRGEREEKQQKTEMQSEANRKAGTKSAILYLSKFRFKKGNTPWIKGKHHTEKTKEKLRNHPNIKSYGFKGKHHTEENKIRLSIMKTGRPGNPKSRTYLIKMLMFNHPMKNPEYRKKVGDAKRLKLPKEVLGKVIKEFNDGKSLAQLAKENKVDKTAMTKLLRRSGVIINAEERNRLDGKINPLKIRTQFKKGQNLGNNYGFKKGNIPWNKKIQQEVKNNEKDNSSVISFNSAVICD